jgi:hypothetical protein
MASPYLRDLFDMFNFDTKCQDHPIHMRVLMLSIMLLSTTFMGYYQFSEDKPTQIIIINYFIIAFSLLYKSKFRNDFDKTIITILNLVRGTIHSINDFWLGTLDGTCILTYELFMNWVIYKMDDLMSLINPKDIRAKYMIATFAVLSLTVFEIPKFAVNLFNHNCLDCDQPYSVLATWCVFSLDFQILSFIASYKLACSVKHLMMEDNLTSVSWLTYFILSILFMTLLAVKDSYKDTYQESVRVLFWVVRLWTMSITLVRTKFEYDRDANKCTERVNEYIRVQKLAEDVLSPSSDLDPLIHR